MRTLIFVGVAAGSVLLAQAAAAAPVAGRADGITALNDLHSAAGHKRGHAPALDYGVSYPTDSRVYTGGADRMPAEGDYRRMDVYRDAPGVTYPVQPVAAPHGGHHGQHGNVTTTTTYGGSVPGYAPQYAPGYGPTLGYDPREADELARLCRRSGGTTGAVVGGALGGVVGNRVAGRGSRRLGTVLGAGAGALAGAAIGNAADRRRCEAYWARQDAAAAGPGGYGYGYGYGQPVYGQPGYGHGWYSPGYVVVTTITNPAPVVTETVTTSVHYETVHVPVRARHVAKRPAAKKRVYRPKPKPRCTC